MSNFDFSSDVVLSLLVGESLLGELLVLSLGVLLGLSPDVIRVLSDLSMNLLVEFLHGLGSALGESFEPSFELDGLLLGSVEGLEVLVDVDTEDSLSQLCVASIGFAGIEAGEA